jgi:hypothetical protein
MLVIAPILTCPSDDSEDTCDEEGAASASATAAASAWESLSHGEVSDIGTRRVAKYVAPVVAVPFVPKPVSTLSQKTALVSGSGSSDAMVLNAACPNDWGDVPSRGEPGTPEGRTLNTGSPSKKQRCSSESATHSCTSTMDGMRSACELDEFAASQESIRACLDSQAGQTISTFSREALVLGDQVDPSMMRKIHAVYDANVGQDKVFPTKNGPPKILTMYKDKPYEYEGT